MSVAVETTTQDDVTPLLPDPGQVVEVRGSMWAVTDVRSQGLLRSPADETAARTSHVISLQSLDEDRLGEELAVVWELEIGHSVTPDRDLPQTLTADGFDEPSRLAAFVDAVRWGAVTSADADTYQAPFRSGATVEAYQLEPLRRALSSPRTNLLLADDVGLGKTIEAGLVVQELLLRHRARSVIVVCPPSLAVKWRDEMLEKFGLDFVIVTSETLAEVRRSHGLAANPLRLFPRVIVSMAWLPGTRAQRMLREVFAAADASGTAGRYAFDVLVVDEAHHVAPSSPSAAGGGRGYAVDSKRTEATRELAKRCEHRLFLSATPHNGHPESFTALLEMIDGRRFTRGARLDEAALREVTVRRLKAEITDKGFKTRKVSTLPFVPGEDEQSTFEDLDLVLRESARANGRQRSGDLVAMLLKKRLLSSPWAFACTMELYEGAGSNGFLPDDDLYDEVLGSEADDEEEGLADQPELTALRRSKGSDPLVAADQGQIDALAAWGRRYEKRPDARLNALIGYLDAVCRPDGTWSNERVVVFTEYADTLEWIEGVLRQRGYDDVLATIRGGMDAERREEVRSAFTASPTEEPVRVLLATDSAGEGIDLQNHCHRLVNYDIPFNPSRLEQRIGRIDRYGQTEHPEVAHFAPVTTSSTYAADADFLRRIAEKVATVAAELGSANQVIDAEVQAHFSPGSVRTKAKGDDGNAIITRTLAGGIELNRRLTELSRTYEQLQRDLHLTPASSRRVLDTALALSNQPPLEEIGDERTDAAVFELPSLRPSWRTGTRGMEQRRRPDLLKPVTFDGPAAAGRDDLVHVHLGHPLMQKASRMLRSTLFSGDSTHRVTAVVVDDLPMSCVAAVSRLVLVGRGGLRLHEEVFLTGIRLRGQAMAEEKVEALLDSALDGERLVLAGEDARASLAAQWNAEGSRMRARLIEAVGQRAQRRQERVAAELVARERADTERAREIFSAFRRNLHESSADLRAEFARQEEQLFADDQQAQRRRDLRVMEERLASVDDEERREVAAIEQRYTDVAPHVTNAAVVFALTPADAAGMTR